MIGTTVIYAIARLRVMVVGLENAEVLLGSEKSKLFEELWPSLPKRLRCSGFGEITDVLITIRDTHSCSFGDSSAMFLSGSSTGVFSLQGRFDGGFAASGILVCLMIAENADDEFLWSRFRSSRGTITLVGEAVTQGVVVASRFNDEDDNGGQDLADTIFGSFPSVFSVDVR